MTQNPKFNNIIQGMPQKLQIQQFSQFKTYCSTKFNSLQQWLSTTMNLFKIDKQISYQFLLHVANNEATKPQYNDIKHHSFKIKIYNTLVSFSLGKAVRQSKSENSQKWITEASKYYNLSQKVTIGQKSTIITRAFLHYYRGQIIKAANIFNKSYQESMTTDPSLQDPDFNKNLVTTILGLAQTHFVRKNYQKALDLYKKALINNKNLPSKARLGMGYCFYFLNKFDLAQLCFKRIIKLDPQCIQAYIALAVLSDKNGKYEDYFNYLIKAYKLNSKHPLILLHLAQHFLFKRNDQKCKKMCFEGLKALQTFGKFIKIEQKIRNDHDQYIARFNNILGQIHHRAEQYQKALSYYNAAQGKGLQFNSLNISQIYMHPSYQNYVDACKILQQMYLNITPRQSKLLGQGHKQMAYLKSKIAIKSGQQGPGFYYNQALKHNKNDYQAYIQYSNLTAQTKKAKTLQLLLEAQKVLNNIQKPIKPQLFNNIAVLYIQNKEYLKSKEYLLKCFDSLDKMMYDGHQEQLRKKSIQLISKFNMGIVFQKLYHPSQAIKLYSQINRNNKYFIDSQIRKNLILCRQGKYQQALQSLDQYINIVQSAKSRVLRMDKLYSVKAHILHLMGKDNKSRQILRNLIKSKDVYSQFYQICIQYEGLIKRQVQLSVLKEFIRPKRQFCIKLCQQDPFLLFPMLILLILLVSDKKITKVQGIQYFNMIKDGQKQIPSIILNMAIFLFNYDDYENAKSTLLRYRQKIKFSQVNDLPALINLIQGNYNESIKQTKRNILLDPKSAKHRYQLAYICQKKIDNVFHENTSGIEIKSGYQTLKKANNIYHFLSKINTNQLLKNQSTLQAKDKLRPIYTKIKHLCDQRKMFVKSRLQYYERAQQQIQRKQKQERQNQRRLTEMIREGYKQNNLFNQLMNDEDQEERKQKQLQQQKKRCALARLKQMENQMNKNWQQIQAQDTKKKQEKKQRRQRKAQNPANPTTKKQNKKKEKIKEDLYDKYNKYDKYQDNFIDNQDYGDSGSQSPQDEYQSEQSSKNEKRQRSYSQDSLDRAQKRNIKKIKKNKHSDYQSDQQKKSDKQSMKQQQMDEDLKKYMVDEE